MRLTIDNQTEWDGRDLRVLCRRVIDHTDGYGRRIEIATTKRNKREKELNWKVNGDGSTCRTNRMLYSGYASINSRRKLYMGVPKVEREIDGQWYRAEFNPVEFARVMEHEILHNQGLRHGDMTDDTRYCQQDVSHMGVEDLTVNPKPSFEGRVE